MAEPLIFAVQSRDGLVDVLYTAQDYQAKYHLCATPNYLIVGPRGTGKSTTIRMDSHMRSMAVSGFRYLTLRRTMRELKKSHLSYVGAEMERLGGTYNKTDAEVHYPNGSIGWFGHCESDADVEKHLGGQYDLVNFDEITTFKKDLILKISATARVPEGSGRIAMVRGGTNPLGPGADFVKKYFIDKNPDEGDDGYEDYDPADWGVLNTTFTDNKYIDEKQYRKKFAHFPEHVRRAWLDGEWVQENAYFADFRANKDGKYWHTIPNMPQIQGRHILDLPWIRIYRCFDWGYSPDPAICLWIAVLPNGRAVVFKEKKWTATLAEDVARSIVAESSGMTVMETFTDPTVFDAGKGGNYTIGEIIEQNGVPLTRSINNRMLIGYAIHTYLNTILDDGLPKMQILQPQGRYGCQYLIRTIPEMRTDPKDASKIADGDDHGVIALGYFCVGKAPNSSNPERPTRPKWMRRKPLIRRAFRRYR